jgi:pimeloyl-ACP methyl ester carboxylesterase
MHYVDEGQGHPVILLHGNPTWGFLYRDMIGPLVASGWRVVVPDMIGFGLAGKANTRIGSHTRRSTADLTSLIRQLNLSHITLVCHDWGGPTGLSFAMSNPERVATLVVMSTWAWPLPLAEFHTRLFPWRMMHAPLVGPYLLGRHNALARRGIYLSVVDRERFRREAQPAYEAALPDMEARLLTWVWPRWIPLDDSSSGTSAIFMVGARACSRTTPFPYHLGRTRRRVRRRYLCNEIQGLAATCGRSSPSHRSSFSPGRFQSRDRTADYFVPRSPRSESEPDMSPITVVGKPDLTGKRLVVGLNRRPP